MKTKNNGHNIAVIVFCPFVNKAKAFDPIASNIFSIRYTVANPIIKYIATSSTITL